jgi:signal transduction histidine kinase
MGVLNTFLLIERMLQMRKLAQLKERFAADLHDELGANLHTIGLLSELTRKKMDTSPEEAARLLQRIDAATRRSGIAVQHVTELQSANGLYTNLENEMQQAAERILINVAHELRIEGGTVLARLKPRTQIDLFLFYKECLINISRHAHATHARTHLQADERQITLRVTDNGSGLPDGGELQAPGSLKRRAKLLGAKVSVTAADDGGSCIALTFNLRKWG